MPKVNPDILRWARETAGLDLTEASNKLGIKEAYGMLPDERLSAFEAGENEPSRPLLLSMAKKYHRPLIVFYMEKPPRKGDRGQDFRTLPNTYTEANDALVDALIRDVHVRQSIIRAVLEDEDDVEFLRFVDSKFFSDGVDEFVKEINETIDFDLEEFRNQPSAGDAFNYLRERVESTGVFVLLIGDLGSHHTAIAPDMFRGFALSDEVAPFVVINDRDSQAAWSFTLIHELVHIWLGQTGVSNTSSEQRIEKFCNQVASEFLLPELDLGSLELPFSIDFEAKKSLISEFAYSQNISSSMVAYKLYLLGRIDRFSWIQLDEEYRKLWFESREETRRKRRGKKGGPSYYVVRRHRLGNNLISLVHQMVLGGTLTTIKASKVLGVAPKIVEHLIEPRIQVNSG